MERVLNGILQAEYVIADLTGKNPNVFYELGIAHSCKPPSNVIIISQNAEDVPFDIRSMNYLMYQSNGPGHKQLKRQLTEAIQGEGYRFSIESGKQFELDEHLSGNQFLYKFGIVEIGFGASEAKFMIQTEKYVLGEGLKDRSNKGLLLKVGNSINIEPTDWQLRLERINRTAGQNRAFFSITRRAT
jgi:hypothetical protein